MGKATARHRVDAGPLLGGSDYPAMSGEIVGNKK
jgi:hypothetical protein